MIESLSLYWKRKLFDADERLSRAFEEHGLQRRGARHAFELLTAAFMKGKKIRRILKQVI
jgi:hypothetical protein